MDPYMSDFEYYLAILAALVVGIFLIKKITGCICRIVITLLLLALLAYIGYRLGYI